MRTDGIPKPTYNKMELKIKLDLSETWSYLCKKKNEHKFDVSVGIALELIACKARH